jgi:Ni/Fe-hydrogenase subunit HybB-like protein
MVIFGFVTHRLNVSITGMEAASGTTYLPKWTEVSITLAIVAVGFAAFRLAVKYLPVFEAAQTPAAAPAELQPSPATAD